MLSFNLPNITATKTFSDEQGSQKLKSYLFQLTDQLRYILNNIDTDNFSEELKKQYESAANTAEILAKIEQFTNDLAAKTNGDVNAIRGELRQQDGNLQAYYNQLFEAIGSQATEITKDYTRKFEDLEGEISSTLTEDYTLKSETAALEAAFLSRFQQTARDMMALFTEDYSGDTLGEFAREFKTYIRFSINGIELGRSDSLIVAQISNNKLSFVQKAGSAVYEVAYISDKKLYITEANITTKLTMGSNADGFVFDISSNTVNGLTVTRRTV